MDDIRWFAPNRFCTLPVEELRRCGLTIATEGDAPARLVFASDSQNAVEAFAFARRHRRPMVQYVWDLPPWRLAGGSTDLVFRVGPRLMKIPRPWGGYAERAGYYSRVRYVARHADAVWCPSSVTRADVQRHFNVAATRLPFCYDSERFNLAATCPPPLTAPAVLLSISRLTEQKNHGVLLRAAAQMRQPVAVHIIGRGAQAAALRSEAALLGVTLRLDEGWSSDEEIVAAYRGAAVVVCPSRFEGFGLTPMEGVAMGRPVVASDIQAHREFVNDVVRFFDPDDASALARACSDALGTGPVPAGVALPLQELSIGACATRFEAALREQMT